MTDKKKADDSIDTAEMQIYETIEPLLMEREYQKKQAQTAVKNLKALVKRIRESETEIAVLEKALEIIAGRMDCPVNAGEDEDHCPEDADCGNEICIAALKKYAREQLKEKTDGTD